MKDVTVEDLKAKFVVAKVVPYGKVIMVPGGDFDPDWEAVLEDEGFSCVFTEINGEKFTLVKLEKEEGEEESTTEPSGKHRGAPPGRKVNHWSDTDAERLLKRIEEMPRTITFEDKCAQLVSEFPGRTGTGLEKKYQKLTHGKKRRSIGRPRGDALKEKVESAPKGDLEDLPSAKEHVSTESAGAQLDVVKTLADLEDCVGELLNMAKIDHDIISRLNCAILLQAMETMERQGKLTIPPTLRGHYLNALLQTWDNKVVETFNAKCRALMEASS